MIDNPNPPSKTKAEAFAEEPDRFVDSHTLIFAIARTPEGMGCLCNPKDTDEARRTMVFSNMELSKKIMILEAKAKQSKIIPAPGGIMNAVRSGMFRKGRPS